MVRALDFSAVTGYDDLIDLEEPHKGNGPVYSIVMTGLRYGVQGVDGNHLVFDFDKGAALEFHNVFGGSVTALDANLDSVADTGDALIFQFIGGGTVTVEGLSGYEDFTSLSMDYTVIVTE